MNDTKIVKIKQGFEKTTTFNIVWDVSLSWFDISLVITKDSATITTITTTNWLVVDSWNKNITVTFPVSFSDDIGEYKAYFVFEEWGVKKVSVPQKYFAIEVHDDYIID